MHIWRALLLVLGSFVIAAALAAAAGATGGPTRPVPVGPQAAPVKVVVKTAAMLPGSAYPWVQPDFVKVGQLFVVALPSR